MKILLLGIVIVLIGVAEPKIVKKGKGYSDILVAIHKSIPEDVQLIEKIKTIFQNASSLLYKATSNQSFFRDITIVVPETWSEQPHYQKVYGEFFSKADIKIEASNSAYGDIPYTLQTGSCGKPKEGDYIHLTPGYINTVTSGAEHIYGPTDRLIVHEWAHFRYGIFDEYGIEGDPEFPMFYLEGGKVRASACSQNIRGWVESIDGKPCQIRNKQYFSNNCRFVPDTSDASVASSLMSFNYLPGVTEFCEAASNGGAHEHNWKAPTKQNTFCDRSTWEVITSHNDFENMNSVSNEEYIAPTFRIVRPSTREQRYIFVLDTSSSMAGNRIDALHRATVKLIEDTVPNESYVSIVRYDSSARVVQPIIKVTSTNRKSISANVPKDIGGYTAMGQGLQTALQVIRGTNQATDGAVFILVSDGQENRQPYASAVLPDIKAAKVIVHTIAIDAADKNLETIAEQTGGKSYFFVSSNVQNTVLDGILESTVDQSVDVDLKKEQLIRDEVTTTSTIEKRVTIDKELGNNTIFTVSGQIQNVQLEAHGPKGERYDHTSPGYNKDTGVKSRIQLHLPFAEPGLWLLKIVKNDNSQIKVDVSVTSQPTDLANQPLRIMSYLGDELVKYPGTGSIYARVSKGSKVVIRATVIATISRPGAPKMPLELFDDGTGADLQKDDGIYTRHFTRFTQNGRYSFVITLTNNNGTALAVRPKLSGISPLPIKSFTGKRLNEKASNEFDVKLFVEVKDEDTDEVEEIGEPIGEVVRDEPGTEVLTVTDYTPNVDKIPPNKVKDLKSVTSEVKTTGEMVFTIEWTSPGDNMDDGNAASLDIRISLNADDLRKDKFSSAFQLNETHLIEGTLVPVPGREKHRIVVKLPEEILVLVGKIKKIKPGTSVAFDLYIALRAADASKNVADISNIISLHFGYDIPELVPVNPTPEPEVKRDVTCKKRRISNKLLLSLVVDLDNIDEL